MKSVPSDNFGPLIIEIVTSDGINCFITYRIDFPKISQKWPKKNLRGQNDPKATIKNYSIFVKSYKQTFNKNRNFGA